MVSIYSYLMSGCYSSFEVVSSTTGRQIWRTIAASMSIEVMKREPGGSRMYTRGEVLDIPAREITSAQRNIDDVQVRRLVKSVDVKFNPLPGKTLSEARIAVKAAYGFLSEFAGSSDGISVVKDEIFEAYA